MSHARLAPSNERWPHCPGSVREEAAYEDLAGEAAIDGTGSHLLLQLCQEREADADAYLDRVIGEGHADKPEGWLVKADRCKRVQMCLDYLRRREAEALSIVVESESESNPGEWFGRNDWYGTVDLTISGDWTLEIVDYKDGRGWVSEKDNTQLISYAAGKLGPYLVQRHGAIDWRATPIKKVRMTIVQPKTNPVVRYQTVEPQELWAAATKLAGAAALTDDPEAPLIPGSWCKWCLHGRAGNCEAQKRQTVAEVTPMTEIVTAAGSDMQAVLNLMIEDPDSLSGEQMEAVMNAKPLFTKAFDKVKEAAIRRIEEGGEVPGYYVGPGRASRQWALDDKEMAAKFANAKLKQNQYRRWDLISPAQVEKLESLTERQRENLLQHATTVAGKDTLIKGTKPAEKPAAAELFAPKAEAPKPAEAPAPAPAPAPVVSFL